MAAGRFPGNYLITFGGNVFNLEQAISMWKKSLRKNPSLEDGYIEELEQHLRDFIDECLNKGMDVEDSFNEAVKSIGDAKRLEKEYFKSRTVVPLSNSLTGRLWMPALFANYFKIAVRRLVRNKSYAFINIIGLSVAMAASLLIVLFIAYELSFDSFHAKGDNIYRLNEIQKLKGQSTQHVALSMYPMGPTLKQDFPEVKDFTRVLRGPSVVNKKDKYFVLDMSFHVDPAFLQIFDFEVVHGDPATSLGQPGNVILTRATALKIFGTENAVGKQFEADSAVHTVTGILENVPKNSHLQFDALFSVMSAENDWMRDNWDSNFLVTYLLLEEGIDIKKLESKFPDFLTKYIGEDATETYTLYLQKLSNIHLGSMDITHDYRNFQKFNINSIYTFGTLALLIILIAGINFMNISVAQSSVRSKEVGIRKTLGAFREQIKRQFISESLISTIASFLISIGIAFLVLPYLNDVIGRELNLSLLTKPLFVFTLIGVSLFVGLLVGLYPAFVLSAFSPAKALVKKIHSKGKYFSFRSFLVVTQFAISIALIVATGITIKQLDFIRNKNLGFETDQVILVKMNNTANEKYDLLKNEMKLNPDVIDVTHSSQKLVNNIHQMGVRYEGADDVVKLSISNVSVDYNFIPFYEMEIIEGRNFSEEIKTDFTNAYIINETLQNQIGWENPVGKRIKLAWLEEMGKVIGVVEDFNFNSLHNKVEPLLMSVQGWGASDLAVKINASAAGRAISQIKDTWNKHVPDRPFEYEFMDEHFKSLYESDEKTSNVISLIAGLSIFIACLGLFGLSSIIVSQRTKEIGIRKVLGASLIQLFSNLSSDFLKLVLVAFIISVPVTMYFMNSWLDGFVYRIEPGVWLFVLSGLLAIFIALITISFHTVKASLTNPIKSLRYE